MQSLAAAKTRLAQAQSLASISATEVEANVETARANLQTAREQLKVRQEGSRRQERAAAELEVTRAQASASIDRVFVAVCDRVGTERGVEWVGGSAIIHPDGHPLTLARFAASGEECGEQTLLAECDLADARRKGTSPHNGVVSDRRPELYGAVVRART